MTIDSVSERTVSSGSTVTISYTVSNLGGEGESGNGRFDSDVSTSAGRCNNGCSPSDQIAQSKTYEASLTAPTVAAGQTQTMTITVVSKDQAGASSQPVTANVTVQGPAAPTTVRQVSGRIKDDGGARIAGVQVVMRDSQGHSYNTTTDASGGYSFTSSDAAPIAVGTIQVAAAKTGYDSADASVQGTAGRTVNVSLTMKKAAAETTSPTPSASASASATPTDEATEEEDGTEEGSTGVNNIGGDTQQTASNSDDGGSSWLLIVMGGLLVAAGIGAMVLVWMRRKKAEELASDTGIGQVPAQTGGRFDATRVAAPVGVGRGGDATMIAPAAGMGMGARSGGLGDAPTVIHRPPVEDEFPDPYGAPLPPGGGYSGGNQWDDQPQPAGGSYGGGNYGGATQTYGQQQAGGYDGGGQQRYDEHTNLYQPEQPQQPRYDEHTNLYQPEQGGGNYGGGYDQAGYDQAGYEQGWNGQDAGGYGQQQPVGYDQGGYPQQGGNYGGYDQAGYDQHQQGVYPPQQQGGGNYGVDYPQPPQQGGGNYGQRPSRDWDDN